MSWVTELLTGQFDYWLALYHGLVTRFSVKKNPHRRLSTCATTMRVRFVYERRRYATMVKIRHGLATLNSNNSLVYGKKHKVWVLVFSVRTSGTVWDQIWADLVKFSALQQNHMVYSNSIHETLLSISSNGLGNGLDNKSSYVPWLFMRRSRKFRNLV